MTNEAGGDAADSGLDRLRSELAQVPSYSMIVMRLGADAWITMERPRLRAISE